MALLKEIKNQQDIPLTYWKINSFHRTFEGSNSITYVQLAGYLDSNGRNNNHQIESKTYKISETINLVRTDIYNHLKTLNEFQGAEDI